MHWVTSIKQAETILHYSPDINAPDNDGFTPVEYITARGHFNIAHYLIKRNANISWEFQQNNEKIYTETEKHSPMRFKMKPKSNSRRNSQENNCESLFSSLFD